jgi:transcriptional regulator with XRE-family HTH domain
MGSSITNGAASAPKQQRTFGERLEAEMEARNLAVKDAAKMAGVSKEEVGNWLDGSSYPDKVQIRRVFGTKNPVEFWLPPPSERAPQLPADRARLGAVGLALITAGVVAAPPETFGAALKREREELGFSQEQVGELMGVEHTSIGNWERNDVAPTAEHLAKLHDLFPGLASAPKPASRASSKPGPKNGSPEPASAPTPAPRVASAPPPMPRPSAATAPALAPPPSPAPAPAPEPPPAPAAPPDPLAALDRVNALLEENGQRVSLAPFQRDASGAWSLSIVVPGAGGTLAEGRGPTMSAAATATLASLKARSEERLARARKITEAAFAREEQIAAAVAIIDAAIRGA